MLACGTGIAPMQIIRFKVNLVKFMENKTVIIHTHTHTHTHAHTHTHTHTHWQSVPFLSRHVLSDEEEETRLHLVYACRTQHDILMKDLLNEYSSHWNFRVTYYLSQVSNRPQ